MHTNMSIHMCVYIVNRCMFVSLHTSSAGANSGLGSLVTFTRHTHTLKGGLFVKKLMFDIYIYTYREKDP